MQACLNLRELYGAKYRVEQEESHAADRGEHSRYDDPWTMVVLCEHGHVGPYGDDELFASTNRSGTVAKALRTLDSCRVWQDGSDGLNVVFSVADAKRVFAVMRPRRKRRLTPEQRQAAIDRLAKYQFSAARQSDSGERHGVAMAIAGSEPTNRPNAVSAIRRLFD